jgi:dTDP-4-amino-4,6-dideoxygalactose transaminase
MIPDRIIHSKPTVSKKDKESVLETLDSGFVGQGKQVEKANAIFSSLFKKKTTFFVNSGTSAFFLALKGLNIMENDEVILPNYICGSIYGQVKNLKATPIVIDTIANSFFVSPETVLKSITSKTKAIVINHPFGHFEPAILELRKIGVPIIEDVTHSLYAQYGKVFAGSISDVTIASFGSTKFITSGTGGIVSFLNNEQAQKVEKLLDHDYNTFPANEGEIRYNYKLGDVNAALLLSQLKHIESLIKKRLQLAHKYYTKLIMQAYPANFINGSVYFRFFIQVKKNKAKDIRAKLSEYNIDSALGAVSLVNQTFPLSKVFPNSEQIWSELISIPIYPDLKSSEIDRILKVLNAIQ